MRPVATGILVVAVSVLLAAGPRPLGAHGGATGIVKERMDAMKRLGAAMKVLGAMVKGGRAFEPVAALDAARAISGHAGEAIVSQFPEGSDHPPSEASPAVWGDPSGFRTRAREFSGASRRLEAAVDGADVPDDYVAALRATAAACKACHERFRED